jgi:hypothetical protein
MGMGINCLSPVKTRSEVFGLLGKGFWEFEQKEWQPLASTIDKEEFKRVN